MDNRRSGVPEGGQRSLKTKKATKTYGRNQGSTCRILAAKLESEVSCMGRPKFFRQRLVTQAASLEAKGLFNYLVSEIKTRREVSLEEAILIARDVEHYLEQNLLTRAPGEIEFPAIAGRDNHRRA